MVVEDGDHCYDQFIGGARLPKKEGSQPHRQHGVLNLWRCHLQGPSFLLPPPKPNAVPVSIHGNNPPPPRSRLARCMPLVICNQFLVIGSLFFFREFNFPATAKIYTAFYAAIVTTKEGALQFAWRDNPSLSSLRTCLRDLSSRSLMIVVRFTFRHTHTHFPLSTHHHRLCRPFCSRTNGCVPAPLIARPYSHRPT